MANRPSILIRNGEVATLDGLQKADVLIRGEKIVAVEPGLTISPGVVVIQARRRIILPGLIDTHAHFSARHRARGQSANGREAEDIFCTTRAALAGGVTTVLGMPDSRPPLVDASHIAHALTMAAQNSLCDHGFFLAATHNNHDDAPRVSDAVGMKLYMGSVDDELLVNDFATQYKHFDAYPPNRIIALHAEDEGALRYFVEREQISSPLSAEIAMARAIAMAADLQRRVHICHISTAREIELVRQAKTRGHQVTCEVTPHHLFLSTEIDQHLGALGRISPPLRTKDDADALWDNLKWIDCIGSDHTPYTVTDKQNKLLPEGVPGLESMLSVLLTAVHQQLMSYADLVRLTSAGPAKLFGLADKGRIEDGAHADLVIVNPAEQGRIEASKMHSPCGWTPFEGWRTRGKVEQVFLRGRAVFKDGEFTVKSGYGQRVRQVGAEMDWWRIET